MGRFSLSRRADHSQERPRRRTRRCRVEALERRLLLASDLDLLSPAAYELADVNRDSILTPADPLLVINAINRTDETQLPSHFDLNGDTVVDATDVDFILRVFAARHSRSGDGSGGTMSVASTDTTDLSTSTLVAQADSAYTYDAQAIEINVLNNDSGTLFSISSATNGSQGTTQIVDGNRIVYTPTGALASSDAFTYTITDYMGATDSATVTVDVLKMTDYTVERQQLDGSWVAVPDVELSWAHDTLRWTPVFSSTTHSMTQGTTSWTAVDRNGSTVGTGFAMATHPTLAIGNPGAGLWNVNAATEFTSPNQSMFSAQMDTPKEKDVAMIESVKWLKHPQVDRSGDLVSTTSVDEFKFYPDAATPPDDTTPGGAARNWVNVAIKIHPQIGGVPLYLKWLDVDDPTSNTAPVDDESGANGDVSEADNRLTGTGAAAGLASSTTTTGSGEVHETFAVGWIQPGNNFRIAVSPRQDELTPVEAIKDDPFARLFYDADGSSLWDSNEGPLMDNSMFYAGVGVSPLLTVWRYLHVEVDSMRKVTGNSTGVDIDFAVRQGDKSIVTLVNALPAEDDKRYQNGSLTDSQGNQFTVVANSTTTVSVQLVDTDNDGDIDDQDTQPAAGNAVLVDDDHLKDGMDVPMPDTSELAAAMEEAFVSVLYDVGDNNDLVDFDLNVEDEEHQGAADWDSMGRNSRTYWVAYLLGAHQGPVENDYDPDGEPDSHNGSNNKISGGSLIYKETIYDKFGSQAVLKERDTVVHELGHAVGDYSAEDNPTTTNVHEGPTRWPDVPSRYSDAYLNAIRSNEKPRSL